MATSKKSKITLITGDEINPQLSASFVKVVGASLDAERVVWLEACDLMARGISTVRGIQATLENTISTIGNLPSLSVSQVQYWLKARELSLATGGDKKSLKELFRLAREVSAEVNRSNTEITAYNKKNPKAKKSKNTFESVIEKKSIAQIRTATPTQSEQKKRKPSTAKNTKYTEAEIAFDKIKINALIKGLNSRLTAKAKADKFDMDLLFLLSETINSIVLSVEEVEEVEEVA